MRAVRIIRTLAAVALLAVPSTVLAAPDQNSNHPNSAPCGYYNNNGQWVGTPCVGQNGQRTDNEHHGQWNDGQHGHNDGDDERDGENENDNGSYHHGYSDNGSYDVNRGGWYNGADNGNRNRGDVLLGSVSSFSPYNLYLSNGTHVQLHNGTIINPTGATLTRGERVRVIGHWNNDGTYSATRIDVANPRY
ncbi:MAG: hypothetical protein NVS3B7_10750 [Candidatus Elarobacter sp.]